MAEMDRDMAKRVGQIAEKALRDAFAKEGVTVERAGNGTFDPDAGTLKQRFCFKVSGGKGEEALEFERYVKYQLGDLEASDLGARFTTSEGAYEVAGMMPRARTKTILAKRISNGKLYRFDSEAVSRMLKVERAEAGK